MSRNLSLCITARAKRGKAIHVMNMRRIKLRTVGGSEASFTWWENRKKMRAKKKSVKIKVDRLSVKTMKGSNMQVKLLKRTHFESEK